MSSHLPHETKRYHHTLIARSLVAALSACAAGQEAPIANGEIVAETGQSVLDNSPWVSP